MSFLNCPYIRKIKEEGNTEDKITKTSKYILHMIDNKNTVRYNNAHKYSKYKSTGDAAPVDKRTQH